LQEHPKFTKIAIFGLKINHLATLSEGERRHKRRGKLKTGTPIKKLQIVGYEKGRTGAMKN
jgi:hypothetical protein